MILTELEYFSKIFVLNKLKLIEKIENRFEATSTG